MNRPMVLRTFGSRPEAELASSILAGSGIHSHIVSDDCGSLDPALCFGRGVHVLVAAAEFERANKLLSEG